MADNPISLCLSGGGLRATLFHLGVVRALREHRMGDARLIDRIGHVYAVSGGSILAAHMALKWELYTGDDDAFAQAQREIYALAQRNIRDRVLRRAVLSAIPLRLRNLVAGSAVSGRTHWLMGEYDHLLGKTRIDAATGVEGTKPTFHFLATNFMTGELCSFSGNHFEVESHERGLLTTPCGHLTLSRAVAASSAFPPMFPPMLLDDKLLARPRDDTFLLPLQLSDGGVYDNLGIEKFWRMLERSPDSKGTLLVSNAGSPFRSEASRKFSGMLSRNVRASDILMRRIGMVSEADIAANDKIEDIVIRLTDAVPDGALDPAVQQTLRLVRTDLDRFAPELADLLVEHGAGTAQQQFKAKGWLAAAAAETSLPPPDVRQRQKQIATRAETRSFLALPFDWRDWKPLLLLWLIAGLVVWQAYGLWRTYDAAKDQKRLDEQARNELLIAQTEKLAQVSDALSKNQIDRARALLAVTISETQVQQEKAAAALAPEPAPAPTGVAVTAGTEKVTYPMPVYIQFAGNLKREQIVALNASLRKNGWNTQSKSGERIAGAAGLNEVRYAGDNAAAAQQLADAINAAQITSAKVTAERLTVIGPRNLEVWISN